MKFCFCFPSRFRVLDLVIRAVSETFQMLMIDGRKSIGKLFAHSDSSGELIELCYKEQFLVIILCFKHKKKIFFLSKTSRLPGRNLCKGLHTRVST